MKKVIRLVKGYGELVNEGDLIVGENSDPKTVREWEDTLENEAEAVKALENCRCTYSTTYINGRKVISGTEYALAYITLDDDDEIAQK